MEFSKHSQDRVIGTKGDIAHVSTRKAHGCEALAEIEFSIGWLLIDVSALMLCVTDELQRKTLKVSSYFSLFLRV